MIWAIVHAMKIPSIPYNFEPNNAIGIRSITICNKIIMVENKGLLMALKTEVVILIIPFAPKLIERMMRKN